MRIRIEKKELDDLIEHLDDGRNPRCRWNEIELIDRLARDLKDARLIVASYWTNGASTNSKENLV